LKRRQHDFLSLIVDLQAFVGHGDKMLAEAEKAANLLNCEHDFVAVDDHVVDAADPLILVIRDAVADQLGYSVAMGEHAHIDFDEVNALRESWFGGDDKSEHERDQHNQHRGSEEYIGAAAHRSSSRSIRIGRIASGPNIRPAS
jgi:hypothetical protein